jgi:hypothetical protein
MFGSIASGDPPGEPLAPANSVLRARSVWYYRSDTSHGIWGCGPMMKTLAFQRSVADDDPYLVLLHTAASPEPSEWHGYVREMAATLSVAVKQVQVFVVTDGGGPDAKQRKELADVIQPTRVGALTHVFTTNVFVRGIVTAFRWLGGAGAVSHHPNDFPNVCSACGFLPVIVLSDLRRVQEEIDSVQTLAEIEETMRGLG